MRVAHRIGRQATTQEVATPMRTNRTPVDRFWSKVNFTDTCWLWTDALTWGYGRFTAELGSGKMVKAHRYAYEFCVAQVPDDLELDHLCRVKHCVNPDHLEAVTHRENTLRGIGPSAQLARQTHCASGHEFTEANTYIRKFGSMTNRTCRQCRRERMRQYRTETVEAIGAQ